MKDWRFNIRQDGTIERGRPYKVNDDSGDQWRWYWEDDTMVAFVVRYGVRRDVYGMTEGDDTDRAVEAYRAAIQYAGDVSKPMKTVAARLTKNRDADFLCIDLGRDMDLYALSWDGDPDRTWRHEIEAVYNGDVWRMEVEEYNSATETREPAEGMCEEWYGEGNAETAHHKEFPLDAAPAELHLDEAVGA